MKVATHAVFALLFYPVSRVGIDGLVYRLGGDDQLYGRVTKVTDGDTITLGLARTTTFSHEYRREFDRLREVAEARGAGLWGACSEAPQSFH